MQIEKNVKVMDDTGHELSLPENTVRYVGKEPAVNIHDYEKNVEENHDMCQLSEGEIGRLAKHTARFPSGETDGNIIKGEFELLHIKGLKTTHMVSLNQFISVEFWFLFFLFLLLLFFFLILFLYDSILH